MQFRYPEDIVFVYKVVFIKVLTANCGYQLSTK